MMKQVIDILSRPGVILMIALGVWGLDKLIGFPVFVAIIGLAVVGVTTAGFIYWRKERKNAEE